MAVWAFACKNESSNNRWFDGTDQAIGFEDNSAYDFVKSTDDVLDTLDEQRKVLLKNISQVRSSLGSMMFNEVMFNNFYNKLMDFDNAVFMQDDVLVDMSRAVVRVDDTIYTIEYFNKEIYNSKDEAVVTSDDSLVSTTNGADSSNICIDSALMSDVTGIGTTKTIPYTADDSIGFTETFNASIGGKSIYDIVDMSDGITKTIDNVVGDESRSGSIGTMVFNELMFNGEGTDTTVNTVIGLTEEVQIILTEV